MHRERRCATPARRATEAYSVSTPEGAELGFSRSEKPYCEEPGDEAISIWCHVAAENSQVAPREAVLRGGVADVANSIGQDISIGRETSGCSGDRMPAYLWSGVLKVTVSLRCDMSDFSGCRFDRPRSSRAGVSNIGYAPT